MPGNLSASASASLSPLQIFMPSRMSGCPFGMPADSLDCIKCRTFFHFLYAESLQKTLGSSDRLKPSAKSPKSTLLSLTKMTAAPSSGGSNTSTTSSGRRRPRDFHHPPAPFSDGSSHTMPQMTRPRPSSSRHSPRLLLAATTLALGCAILFLPSLSLSSRANRRLSAQTMAEDSVDDTVHSSCIRTARDRLRQVATNSVNSGGGRQGGQNHRSLQRSSNGDMTYKTNNALNTANTLPNATPPANAVAANASNRARGASSGRRLVTTRASEGHTSALADNNSGNGRRLGLGSTLSDAAASAGLSNSVVDTIGNAISQLASMTSTATSAGSNGVRNIGRERQLAEVWDSPTLYDTPTFWHVSVDIKA